MTTKKKMLVVDDIELNRAILGELFHDKYEVLEASNGVEAVETLKQYGETIAVVLLDIIMPVMDGFGVLREMPKNGWAGRIPIVMITAETTESVMQKGYEMGVADIINKPFAPNVIRQRIHNIVEQYTYKLHLEKLVNHQTDELRKQTKKLRENSAQMIDMLSAVIEFKNTESVGHIHNIRKLTRILLQEVSSRHKEYGLSQELIEVISEASAMHDIGKVAIPDYILNKPGKLTKEEFEIMQTHSVRGCEILEKLSHVQYLEYYDYCYEICRHHHERWDGGGYPDGLEGDETPIWAQVVSLVDVYDALISKRVYKEAYTCDKAVEMITRGECGTFNPTLLQCFLSIVPTLKSGMIATYTENYNREEMNEKRDKTRKQRWEDVSTRTLHLLELERQKYKIMSELSEEIMFDYDCKTDQLIFSDKYQILTGKDTVIAFASQVMKSEGWLSQEDEKRLRCTMEKTTKSQPSCKVEVQIKLDGKSFAWYEVYLYAVWDTEEDMNGIGFMGKLINIEKQKREKMQLQEAADNDQLTGLLNRNALSRQVQETLGDNAVTHGVLCFIDIDNFKNINDTFGHLFGDIIIKQVASILKSCARRTDFVGRIGGDEFAVFFEGLSNRKDLENKLHRICENLCKTFDGCNLSCSLGAACYPADGDNFERLLERADKALYGSKRLGKNRYQVYDGQSEKGTFHSLQSKMDY